MKKGFTPLKYINRTSHPYKFSSAFTLAEVLITLGIIGIVATLTMPSILQNQKEKQTVTKLKKTYSILSQAYISAKQENGQVPDWGAIAKENAGSAQPILEKFAPHLKIVKNCGYTQEGCISKEIYTTANSKEPTKQMDTQLSFASRAVIADGTFLAFRSWDPNCNAVMGEGELRNMCGFIEVDINGFNKPNTYGIDIFRFYITKNSIIPYGTQQEGSNSLGFNSCLTNNSGYGCTAWVIFNENMDYLHCDDLSWDGKTKCDR